MRSEEDLTIQMRQTPAPMSGWRIDGDGPAHSRPGPTTRSFWAGDGSDHTSAEEEERHLAVGVDAR